MKTIVMIHGWPDTERLWDGAVAALEDRYQCVRFTLPGFERPGVFSLDQLLKQIGTVVAGRRVTLLVHDWGCFLGYQFAMRHPDLVERIIGVDIGDTGSRAHRKELGLKGRLMVVAYQVWLALAWRLDSDAMARAMARLLRYPMDPAGVRARMGYLYALRWLGVAGGLKGVRGFKPACPMLYIYGERKPVLFHSRPWVEQIAAQTPNRVVALPTGHWVMITARERFNQAVRTWLADTDALT